MGFTWMWVNKNKFMNQKCCWFGSVVDKTLAGLEFTNHWKGKDYRLENLWLHVYNNENPVKVLCFVNQSIQTWFIVTHHWGKSGAVHCPMFSDAKAVLGPWRDISTLSLRARSVVSIGLSFPHAPHTMSATSLLTLIASLLVELKDSWRLVGLLILTVLSETTTFTLFLEKVVWVIALPFVCEHRLNTL